MHDPHKVLGIASDADAATIRQRYLELVRQFPPERNPQEFGEIRAAYDHLRDPVVYLEQRLLNVTDTRTIDSLLTELQPDVRARRLPTDLLLSLSRP